MKLHPVISIILGLLVYFILISFASILNNFAVIDSLSLFFVYFVTVFVGGFIATYLAKEMNIEYGIYEGLLIVVLGFFIPIGASVSLASSIQIIITATLLTTFFAIIGGFIAKMTDERNSESFKSKHLKNGFSPILAIIAGFVVVVVCIGLLELILGLKHTVTTFGLINFAAGVISFTIGAFVTTFLAREKRYNMPFI